MPNKKQKKVIPLRKKKKHKTFIIITLLFVIILAFALFSPVFNIKAIEVQGNKKFSDKEIINMSNIPLQKNIFKINYFKSRDNILKDEYIKDVQISRNYPNKVKININERKPAAYFKCSGLNVIIDKQGVVLEDTESLKERKIPVIEGMNIENYEIGSQIKANEINNKFNIAKKCINASIKYDVNNVISKINVDNVNDLIAWAYGDKFKIKLIDDKKILYKFKFLANILKKEKSQDSKGIIDFTSITKPVYKPRY